MANIDFKTKAEEFLEEENLVTPEGTNLLAYIDNQFYVYRNKRYELILHETIGIKILQLAHRKSTYLEKYNQFVIREVIRSLEAICLKEKVERGVFFGETKTLNKFYVPFQNCILETKLLDGGNVIKTLLPHSPEFFSNYCLSYDYNDQAECPTFLKIASEILEPDQLMLFQEWLGYLFTYYTKLEVMVFLVGAGANGKSLLCLVVTMALGEENVSSVKIEDLFSDPFFLIETDGKLLNMGEEIRAEKVLPTDKLKDFVSGGKHYANQKYKPRYPFYPTARLMYAGNSIPLLKDTSDATKRRLIVLELGKQFLDPKKRDPRYKDKEFWQGSGELPGIFNWAYEGLVRLHNNNWALSISDEISSKLDALDREINPLKSFIKEYLVSNPKGELWSRDLYSAYLRHCKSIMEIPERHVTFTKSVISHFKHDATISENALWRSRTERDRLIKGIDFKPDETLVTLVTQEVLENTLSDSEG